MAEAIFRKATAADLPAIIDLLADDPLGAKREVRIDDADARYRDAFRAIDADDNQYLCVVEIEAQVVGTLQLTFIQGLARNGSKRG